MGNSDAKLRDLEETAALLRQQFERNANNDAQIVKLENLLK